MRGFRETKGRSNLLRAHESQVPPPYLPWPLGTVLGSCHCRFVQTLAIGLAEELCVHPSSVIQEPDTHRKGWGLQAALKQVFLKAAKLKLLPYQSPAQCWEG